MKNKNTQKSIKHWLLFFIISLLVIGITAFPVEMELQFFTHNFVFLPKNVVDFLQKILNQVQFTNQHFPQLQYGFDWLAFAHIVIAILFIGPYKNPVKNIWVIEFGMIACILIFPLAFICGHIRHIPFYWQLIDCSFGAFGIIPLLIVHRKIKKLENFNH